MNHAPAPAEIFGTLHEYVKDYNADGQTDLFAEDGTWEYPFASGNLPKKISGRENIRAFGRTAMKRSKKSGKQIINYNFLRIYETTDRNTIIARIISDLLSIYI